MSYDLYLHPRKPAKLDRDAFFAWLDCWDHVTRDAERDEVHYHNPDTGVYFHVGFDDGVDAEGGDPNRSRPASAYFNMNFFRPHVFGLEADVFLTRLTNHFRLRVNDPQGEGMGRGKYTSEGFLRGWNAGNRFAARTFRTLGADNRPRTLPMKEVKRIWGWNFQRNDLNEDLAMDHDIDVYVPPIWLYADGDAVRTFALYPNLVPTAIPKVDHVLVLRDELSSPYKSKSKKTPAWVPWDEVRATCQDFEVFDEDEDEATPFLVLYSDAYVNKDTPPPGLAKWVIGLPKWPGKPDRLPPDQVLDAELLADTEASE